MFDIHTHILPCVDDGSSSLEESIKMIEDAVNQGITDIILTPHFDVYGNKCDLKTDYQLEFNKFEDEIKKRNIPIKLYLGNEIYYTKGVYKFLKNKKIFPLGNSDKVLIELSYENLKYHMDDIIYEFYVEGYQVVIAHVERYHYSNYKLIKKWKEKGALIQVNASSFYGDKKIKRLVTKLLRKNLIDYVASDVHSFRKNDIQKFVKDYKKSEYLNFN